MRGLTLPEIINTGIDYKYGHRLQQARNRKLARLGLVLSPWLVAGLIWAAVR